MIKEPKVYGVSLFLAVVSRTNFINVNGVFVALDSLGVHPAHQKRGIGRLLLDWGVQEAAKQGKDCYLVATPAGLPLYRAAGFEDVKVLDIFGTPHVSMRKRVSKVE